MSSVLPQPSNPTASISAAEAAAAVSAAAAANSAGIATAQAGIATTKAGQAAASAAAALASEGIASGAASTATTQAGIATAQAGITTTKAGEAAASAAAALVSEGTASGAAATATTQAGIATTKAGEASASAAAALVSEQNAAATLAGSVRFDVAQPSITPAQQQTARTNIGVVTAGGVSIGAGGAFEAQSIAANDFEVYYLVKAVTNAGTTLAKLGASTFIYINDSSVTIDGPAISLTATAPAASTIRHINIARSGLRGFSIYLDGVLTATGTATADTSSVIPDNSATVQAGYVIEASRRFNRVLTTDERSAVMRGEVPAALAKKAKTKTTAWANGTGAYQPFVGAFTSSGYGSWSGTTGDGSGTTGYGFAQGGISGKAGDILRVKGNVTTLTASTLRLACYDGVGSYASNVVFIGTTGAFDATLTATADFVDFAFSVANEANVAVAVTIEYARIDGTVARYEPENVTSLGRWLDSSGNGYDLIPGAGITPLKPQPKQRRGFNCVYDMASMQVIDGASLPPGWSITKPNTGVLHVIAPDYVRDGASLRVDAVSEGAPPSRVTCSGYGYRDAGQAQQYYLYVDALDAPHAPVDAMLSLSVSYDD